MGVLELVGVQCYIPLSQNPSPVCPQRVKWGVKRISLWLQFEYQKLFAHDLEISRTKVIMKQNLKLFASKQ